MIREVISDGFCYGESYNRRVNEGTIIKVNALVKTPNSQSRLSFVVEHINGHPEMKGKYGVVESIYPCGQYSATSNINYILDSWFTSHSTSTTGRNKKLLLIK